MALVLAIVMVFMAAGWFMRWPGVDGTKAWPNHSSCVAKLVDPRLSLLGLGVAGYLAFVETQLVHAVCGPVGDCSGAGQPTCRLFGLIPITARHRWLHGDLAVWIWGDGRPATAIHWRSGRRDWNTFRCI
jgi:hypothetical protein